MSEGTTVVVPGDGGSDSSPAGDTQAAFAAGVASATAAQAGEEAQEAQETAQGAQETAQGAIAGAQEAQETAWQAREAVQALETKVDQGFAMIGEALQKLATPPKAEGDHVPAPQPTKKAEEAPPEKEGEEAPPEKEKKAPGYGSRRWFNR